MIEAVHKELGGTSKNIPSVEIEGNTAATEYLHITAPTSQLSVESVQQARSLTNEIISDKTTATSGIFVEPPGVSKDLIEISLVTQPAGTRPIMVNGRGGYNHMEKSEPGDAYIEYFSSHLYLALKRVGCLHKSFKLRVHIGRYFLLSYRQQDDVRCSFNQLSEMVRNPRSYGVLKP